MENSSSSALISDRPAWPSTWPNEETRHPKAGGRSFAIMPTESPRWIQAKLIQSFENYDIAHAPLRSMDGVDAYYRLLIDLRGFQVTGNSDPDPAVEIAFSARILAKDGRIVASRLFQEN